MKETTRVLIRFIGTPILLGLLALIGYFDYTIEQPLALAAVVALVAAVALVEVFRMMRLKGYRPALILGVPMIALSVLATKFQFYPATWLHDSYVDFAFLILCLMATVFFNRAFGPADALVTIAGYFYVMLLKFILVAERIPFFQHRYEYIFFYFAYLFAISKLPDTFGYLVGKFFGRHKLAPAISPNKTWEGAIAGFVGGCAGGIVVLYFSDLDEAYRGVPPVFLYAMTASCTIIAMVSDLVKSAFKRWAGVKDSGIIPEFGGVLDMIDSFILSAPAVYGANLALWHLFVAK